MITSDNTRLMTALKKAWIREDEWREKYEYQAMANQLLMGQLANKVSRLQKDIEQKDILLEKAGYPQDWG